MRRMNFITKKEFHRKEIALLVINVLIINILLFSCAQIGNLTGGAKDVAAPELLGVYPPNKSTNVTPKRITLSFNEYVKLNNPSQAVIFSPPLNPAPEFSVKGKSVNIDIKEGLQANTTYQIQFNQSIADNNEGNQLGSYNYVFSTGPIIDSLSLTGAVVNAFDNTTSENIVVGLYNLSDAQDILSANPRYLVKQDLSGNFTFNYIKSGEYSLVAFQDANFNNLPEPRTELIGFKDETITLTTNKALEKPIVVFENERPTAVKKVVESTPGHLLFTFTNPVQAISVNSDKWNDTDYGYFNEGNDTLHYWYGTDQSAISFFFEFDNGERDTVEVNLKDGTTELLVRNSNPTVPENEKFEVMFTVPIISFTQENIYFEDSLGKRREAEIEQSSPTLWRFSSPWKRRDKMVLVIEEGALVSNVNTEIPETKLDFNVEDPISKASLIMKFTNSKSTYLVQLLSETGKTLGEGYIGNNGSLTYPNLKEGKYALRVFEDANGNERWDLGSLQNRKQAEPTIYYLDDIEIKGNWDKELEITF